MSVAVMLVLATTFLVAGVAKLRDPAPFAATLARLAGARAARPLAVAIPAGELVLAGALLAGLAPRAVAAATLLVLAGFSAALLRIRRTRDLPACACFGAGGSGDPAGGLARNAVLGALALALLVAPTAAAAWTHPISQLVGAATVALGACCCWTLASTLARVRAPVSR